MREFTGIAINPNLYETSDGRLRAAAELVILVSEPRVEFDAVGQIVTPRALDTLRFSISLRNLPGLIGNLQEYCRDLEKLEARASLSPETGEVTEAAE